MIRSRSSAVFANICWTITAHHHEQARDRNHLVALTERHDGQHTEDRKRGSADEDVGGALGRIGVGPVRQPKVAMNST